MAGVVRRDPSGPTLLAQLVLVVVVAGGFGVAVAVCLLALVPGVLLGWPGASLVVAGRSRLVRIAVVVGLVAALGLAVLRRRAVVVRS